MSKNTKADNNINSIKTSTSCAQVMSETFNKSGYLFISVRTSLFVKGPH